MIENDFKNTDSMNNKLDCSINTLMIAYVLQMNNGLSYAYQGPKETFQEKDGHTAIQVSLSLNKLYSKYCTVLLNEIEEDTSLKSESKLLCQNSLNYLLVISKKIDNSLNLVYPNDKYEGSKAHKEISKAFNFVSVIDEFREVFKESLPNIKIHLNRVINATFNYEDIINKVYPNDKFEKKHSHECLQRFRKNTFVHSNFIFNIIKENLPQENDFDLKKPKVDEKLEYYLGELHTKLKDLADLALIAYPDQYHNENLGHTAFTQCIKSSNNVLKFITDNNKNEYTDKVMNDVENNTVDSIIKFKL